MKYVRVLNASWQEGKGWVEEEALPLEERKNLKMVFYSGWVCKNNKPGVPTIIRVKDFEKFYGDKITGYTNEKDIFRKELLGAPLVEGYLSPSYDGPEHPLRYETQEEYDILTKD